MYKKIAAYVVFNTLLVFGFFACFKFFPILFAYICAVFSGVGAALVVNAITNLLFFRNQ